MQLIVLVVVLILVAQASLPVTSFAQQGDKAGEEQKPPPPEWSLPAPARSPEEEMKTFKIAPGFRVELVAAEPLIVAPVAMAWDASGRLWVVEMRAFMPNVDGKGEDEPNGRVSILEDTNGDGRMDKSTTFLDGLVLPRAICIFRDGALIAAPPDLWFCRDTNGDGKADEKISVATDYGGRQSPEHTANGLLIGLDNWIYSANWTNRLRYKDDKWEREPAPARGQWGLTQDDWGRLFYNTNSDQLRGDLIPAYSAHYLSRNKNYRTSAGLNVQIAKDQTCWPIRPTPGVNRGYQKNFLREDGSLRSFTAVCGPAIYRGNLFPDDCRGNAFIAEPSAYLIRRSIITEDGLNLTAKNAYDKSEFLASTDERFRPVNCYSGPDGALYIADMYRGILQHRIFVTTFLRKQILERGLETPIDRGRIWRIVPDGKKPEPIPNLAQMKSTDLVAQLAHPNGWVRDTAQRLLVERQDNSVAPKLSQLMMTREGFPNRIHALWTLDGLGRFDETTTLMGLSDENFLVRIAAINLGTNNPKCLKELRHFADDKNPRVQLQVAFTLGQAGGEENDKMLAVMFGEYPNNSLLRDAIISGLGGRELEFITRIDPAQKDIRTRLAACVINEGDPTRVTKLLDLIETQKDAGAQLALLDATVSALSPEKGKPAPRKISFDAEPSSLASLSQSKDDKIRERAQKIASLVTWKGKPEPVVKKPDVKPLTAEQQKVWEQGKALSRATCAQCHGEDGLGIGGKAPPQVGSEWTLGPEGRIARIVLNGLRGPIRVQGVEYNMEMPAFRTAFDDTQIAAILTYIRREWGHTADPVTPAAVKKAREETKTREEPWTEKELLQIK